MTYHEFVRKLGYNTGVDFNYVDVDWTPEQKEIFDYFVNDRKDNLLMAEPSINFCGKTYRVLNATVTEDAFSPMKLEVEAYIGPGYEVGKTAKPPLAITNVIFNPPATIVFWSDNTKSVVKCDTNLEAYDPEKGIAMAISRKMLADNKRDYYNVFKHWLKKWNKYKEAQEQAERDKNLVEYLEKCFEEEEASE